ncbi:MAG: hypothetical protein ACRD19_04170 [Terriglobia bacterium]
MLYSGAIVSFRKECVAKYDRESDSCKDCQGGDPILIPSISLVELIYLVEEGRIPASTHTRLRAAIEDPNGPYELASLDHDVADAFTPSTGNSCLTFRTV